MTSELLLVPQPRQLTFQPGTFALHEERLILLDAPGPSAAPHRLQFSAQRAQQTLQQSAGLAWSITASRAVPLPQIGLALRLTPEKVARPQGYELTITPASIQINAHDEAGVFYGVCTLNQILAQAAGEASHGETSRKEIPCLQIVDWPDFPARGVMLDVSRDKVPTLQTVCDLVDRLASWKINQVQLYTEHTFAYRRHPVVWANASPFTGEEILILDAFCRARHVELVPNQNSFGHLHRWLVHPAYRPLAECPNGYDWPWGGHSDEPFTICPADPGSIQLIREMYDELLPHFSSSLLNIGCDETWDLGQGRSQAECASRGTGRVYLDFLLQLYREASARGRRIQFWGDIIIQHPELVQELPKDVIALAWGYEANHPFDENCAQFAAAGLEFYVCPGTSSWNSIAGRTTNALGNLLNAAENGLKYGASGYLNTDWGDNGHWQPLPVSYLGFLAGAAYSWALQANRALDIPTALSRFAFEDPTQTLGVLACELGDVYRQVGLDTPNNSPLASILHTSLAGLEHYKDKVQAENIRRTLAAVEAASAPLAANAAEICRASRRPDAALIVREFNFVAHALRHACQRALFFLDENQAGAAAPAALQDDLTLLIQEHQTIWLERNRPGGLVDSVARFAKL